MGFRGSLIYDSMQELSSLITTQLHREIVENAFFECVGSAKVLRILFKNIHRPLRKPIRLGVWILWKIYQGHTNKTMSSDLLFRANNSDSERVVHELHTWQRHNGITKAKGRGLDVNHSGLVRLDACPRKAHFTYKHTYTHFARAGVTHTVNGR